MSMERIHKSEFCERELTALLKAVDRDIEKTEYELCDNGEEYVHILYATTGGATTVCVTADSLLALTRDVLKKLD
ncbi:MAG TPA: hypothetical protein DDY61_05455 [Ruminococcaceae bacterium]|nr:hypothetical protein [Oscillospiraceae bacterium]